VKVRAAGLGITLGTGELVKMLLVSLTTCTVYSPCPASRHLYAMGKATYIRGEDITLDGSVLEKYFSLFLDDAH
jgi:hypothetical protein